MASVNRYTNIQPGQYNPRTLQELMIAPAYKREQHTAIEDNLAETEAALAQVDPLAIHSDLARQEQARLAGELESQAETLQREGFNSTSKSDFTRLNKQYQQAISPTGTLGKIQAAKIAAEEEKANILANAIQMGHDPHKSQVQIDKAFADYEDKYRQSGVIENFKATLPPKYKNLMEDIEQVKKLAGTTVKTDKGREGYSMQIDPSTGMLVAVTNSGQVITESDETQLKAGLEMVNKDWLQEGGEGFASAKWNEQDPQLIADKLNSALGLMTSSKVQDTRSKNYQFMKNPTAQVDDSGKIRSFVTDHVKGVTSKSISPNSPLRKIDYIQNFNFDTDGNIIDKGEYKTYEDKVEQYRKDYPGKVEYDKDRGVATYWNTTTRQRVDIPMDSNHMIENFRQLKRENPFLANLSDEELVNTLQEQKKAITSNYTESIDLVGSNPRWLNTRLFGRDDGSNASTSMLHRKGATVNGTTLPADELYEELGYSNAVDFNTKGKPSVTGYSHAMGKHVITVTDSSGEPTEIFVDADEQLKNLTPRTQAVNEALLNGESMRNLGVHSNPKRAEYDVFFVNSFVGEPYIVMSKDKNASSISDLLSINGNEITPIGEGTQIVPFNVYSSGEKNNLLRSDYFAKISGLKETKEKN